MFQKFLKNPYVKASIVLICSGGILIFIAHLVKESKFAIGFETINDTLAPVYIGVVLAFLFFPIYNKVVEVCYKRLANNKNKGYIAVGAGIVRYDDLNMVPDADEKRAVLKCSRFIATTVCLLMLVGIAMLLFYSLIPQLIEGTRTFVDTLPEKVDVLVSWVSSHLTNYPEVVEMIGQLADTRVSEIAMWFQEVVFKVDANSLAQMISTGVISVVSVLFDVFVGILIMTYLLNCKDKLFAIGRKLVAALCNERQTRSVFEFVNIFNDTFVKFIVGRIIDSTIIGVLTYLCLIAFDFSLAPMIAVIVGVTNVIPFFGPFIGAIPSVVILLLQNPLEALYFIPLIFIIQQIDGNIIGPKVVGSAIGIDSFWVLISVLIGGGLFGFIGMALGVPVFAVIYKYVDKFAIRKLVDKEMDINTSDYYSLKQYDIDASEINMKPMQETKIRFRRRKNKDEE